MKRKNLLHVVVAFVLTAGLVLFQSCGEKSGEKAGARKGAYKFTGGPSGGTFQYYAGAFATMSKDAGVNILASASGGSIENIRLVNSGKADFGVVYSGHVYAALNGKLKNDANKYEDILSIAFLYGAPAQLVVDADLKMKHPKELADKRVAVGNAGSGAAANAELYFTELGIWDTMEKEFLGYRAAAGALQNGQIDAFWVFAGYPNASVLEAALQTDVTILDTYAAGEEIGLFEKYPYFGKVVIPAETYSGQTKKVTTFSDATVWVANKSVTEDVVYELMTYVFSQKGLDYLVSVHKSAKEMSVEDGLKNIVTPLHPGAEKFWKEKGVLK